MTTADLLAGPRGRRLRIVALAFALLGLTGCAGADPSSTLPGSGLRESEAARRTIARDRVAGLARAMSDERPSDIDGWARAAVSSAADDPTGEFAAIELIAIDPRQTDRLDEAFGTLDLRVPSPENAVDPEDATDTSPAGSGAFCFRVAFDYYGKVGEWSTSDGVDVIDCPVDRPAVIPPPDRTIRPIIPPNAREAARAMLLERAETGRPVGEGEIEAAIRAKLEPPTGPLAVAASPEVLILPTDGGDRVGVAMSSSDDCVLVKSESGVVEDVYAAPVRLQPGELGCTASTALADPEQLRSPH